MSRTWVVFIHSLRTNVLSRQGGIALGSAVVGVLIAFFGMKGSLVDFISQSGGEGPPGFLENGVALLGYMVSLMITVFLGIMLGVGSLTKEKAKGVVESLLAVPLRPWELLWGKTLGVFLPAAILGLALSWGAVWALNVLALKPLLGHGVYPWAALVTCSVGVPLLGFGVSLLVNFLGLIIPNPNLASLVLVLAVVGITNALPRLGMDFSSWKFTWINLALGAALVLAIFPLSSLLTKERIILSARRE